MAVVAWVQGRYFVVTDLRPLLHIAWPQKVTGRKTDLWLVKTVGILILVIGSGPVLAALTHRFTPPLILIAMASALALLAVDLIDALKHVISSIYVLEALLEAAFLAWWTMCLIQSEEQPPSSGLAAAVNRWLSRMAVR